MATLEDAVETYRTGDYTRARKMLIPLSKAGDPEACYILGLMASRGEDCKEDPAGAAEYYQRAADAGHRAAQFNLAALYATGRGVSQDFSTARKWYSQAAELGDTDAMVRLGSMDWRGEGTEVSHPHAGEWWHKAAEAGNTDAMFLLGDYYRELQDIPTAAGWYIEAWQKGNEDAESGLRNLTTELQSLAEDGSAAAQYAIGILKKYGDDDDAAATTWFCAAAERGHPAAARLAGFAYEHGEGIEQDQSRAAALYAMAADGGDVFGMFNYARFLRDGSGGLDQDIDLSITWFRKAAEGGLREALLPLARLLAWRNRTHADANEAIQRLWAFATDAPEDQVFELESGDGDWKATIKNRGESLDLEGITLDELQGLPEA